MGSAMGFAALAVALAVWLLVPSHDRRLGALQPRPRPVAARREVEARELLTGAAAGAIVLAVLPGTSGLLLAPVGAVAGVLVAMRLEPASRKRLREETERELPETLALLAAALEAGSPLRQAVAAVASFSPPATARVLGQVDAQVSIGMVEQEAWQSLADDPVWGPVARDLATASQTGSAVVEVLREHATEARSRRHDARLVRARAMGVRSVLPLMTCFLPAFLLTGVVPVVAGLVGTIGLR